MSMLSEFKQFAMRGNVVDMAIGVIIGGAFGKIITSLVSDVLMPPIGLLTGGVDFSKLAITLKPGVDGKGEVLLQYGKFASTVIDFIIVAFCIFAMIKLMNTLKRKEEAKPAPVAPPPEPSTQEKLLAEIRDLLKQRK